MDCLKLHEVNIEFDFLHDVATLRTPEGQALGIGDGPIRRTDYNA